MYGLLYECKFLTIEETNKNKKFQPNMDFFYRTFFFFGYILTVNTSSHVPVLNFEEKKIV